MKFPKTAPPQAPVKLFVITSKGVQETDLLCQQRGLAVTRALGVKYAGVDACWTVTHVPSGLGVAVGFREDTARALMFALAGVADWQGLTLDQAVRMMRSEEEVSVKVLRAAVAMARRRDSE